MTRLICIALVIPVLAWAQLPEPVPAELAAAKWAAARTELGAIFADAELQFGVPADLLLAVGYVETRWTHLPGVASIDGGWGVMHLVSNEDAHTLEEAAALLDQPPEDLKGDPEANIRGAAALLAKHSGPVRPKTLLGYFGALLHLVALYDQPSSVNQVREIYRVLEQGAEATLLSGETLRVKPRAIDGLENKLAEYAAQAAPRRNSDDYAPAIWNPAVTGNFGTGRGGNTIQYWVNHWIGVGTYAGAISWFKNPSAGVSAHFVCRNVDGELTQMVRLDDTAYHAGNFSYNQRSIGIEHDVATGREGDWNTLAMLQASTTVCRTMCDRYGIPKTRTYILGHQEVPGASTSCPGPLPWTTYMSLLNNVPSPTPTPTPPSTGVDDVLIELRTGGQNVPWYSESGTFADNGLTSGAAGCTVGIGCRYGSTYRSIAGTKRATFAPVLVYAGPYEVFVSWPAAANRMTPIWYQVAHAGGSASLDIDQTATANAWVSLGTYDFPSGAGAAVTVSNEHIDASGSMYAAAAKWVYRGGGQATATPTRTPTATPSRTRTPTATPTNTPTVPASPTATATVPPADFDGDQVPDFREALAPVAGQTHVWLDDSDGDGLVDGVEDANHNGQRDVGETNARAADSDGDGIEDGVEILLNPPADPLNAGSPGSYNDPDNDRLPDSADPNNALRDTDSDRFLDGYEYALAGGIGPLYPEVKPALGDLNLDGVNSNVDALVLQSLFLGLIEPTAGVLGGVGFKRTDANRDGQISNVDALVLQSFFLGLVGVLPPG